MPKPNLIKLKGNKVSTPKVQHLKIPTLFIESAGHKHTPSGLTEDYEDADDSGPTTAKKQKTVEDKELPTLATSNTLSTVSPKTLEKIKQFSAHNDANERMEYEISTEYKRRNESENDDSGREGSINQLSERTAKSNKTIKHTPLEQQVLDLKQKHPGMILMIQTGYKYSFFGEDAEIASRILNILLSQHQNFLTAVIPVARLHVHIRRLVEEGYKVGVVNQTETAAMRDCGENKSAPFSRELVNVYTKATLIGDAVNPLSQEGNILLDGNNPNYIMCVAESLQVPSNQKKVISLGFAAFDPSTGETVYDSFEDGPCREELERRLEHLKPTEILVSLKISQETECVLTCSSARLERLADELFDFTNALIKVSNFFCDQNSESSSVNVRSMTDLLPLSVVCLSVLIHHLKLFGLGDALKINGLRTFTCGERILQMDATVLRNLEVFQSNLGSHKGSLIWVLDHTKTKFGSRLLREWVSQPLRDLNALHYRQEAVTELLHINSSVVQQLQELLTGMPDIDRGLTTCIHQRCGPSSLLIILQILEKLQKDLQVICPLIDRDLKSPLLQDLLKETLHLLVSVEPFLQNINQQAARDGDKTHLLNDYSAYPSVVQRLQDISKVKEKLDSLKPEIEQYLGFLKFEYVTVAGQEYLIEVKNNRKKSVPNSWRKISETKHLTRYRSPDIDLHVKELTRQREKFAIDCHLAWLSFLADFNTYYFHHKKAIKNLATLDALLSLVEVAKQEGYCRPKLINGRETVIKIMNGKHPIISHLISSDDQFVANSTELKSDEQHCMILSGPNMGGKSCYIRQVALLAIMAHIGSYIPADSATISILDSVFTRMGARDELFKGKSTLLLELEEASVIVHKATHHSLVLMDELGRGTSSCDGTSIAVATLHHLLTQVKCLTLFVTHYPAVMELEGQYMGKVQNYHMAFIVNDQDKEMNKTITFLYKIMKGSASRSYGLNVARLANISSQILLRASEKAEELELWTHSKRLTRQQFRDIWCSVNLLECLQQIK